jgi:hypothetical protein
MFMWALAKLTCWMLQNSFRMLDVYFIPPYKIFDMSLNGLRRQVTIHDKTLFESRMEKSSVALDSWHLVLVRGTPLLSFDCSKMNFLEHLHD